jgi:hypothetical protein
MKKMALAMCVAAAAALGFGGAASAQYSADEFQAFANPPSVGPGGAVTVTVTGCEPGETVTVVLVDDTEVSVCEATGPVGLRRGNVEASGRAVVEVVAPMTPGQYEGLASGSISTRSSSFSITVTAAAAAAPSPSGELPSTGSGGIDSTLLIALGALAVGLGLVVVAGLRRRRPAAA